MVNTYAEMLSDPADAGPPASAGDGVPDTLAGGLKLLALGPHGSNLRAVYQSPETNAIVTLYAMRGRLGRGWQPRAAEQMAVPDPMWLVRYGDRAVVVTERDGMVFALVGPTDAVTTAAMATDVSARPPSPSLRDRVEAAGRGLIETFGLAA
jgi:hypothetical protein